MIYIQKQWRQQIEEANRWDVRVHSNLAHVRFLHDHPDIARMKEHELASSINSET